MIRAPVDEYRARKTAGAEFWHVWTVYIPRRSITGKLVWGHRRWSYKRIANDAEAQRHP
jgi:hypothetical protein